MIFLQIKKKVVLLHSKIHNNNCLSGGIGRRARRKLVFFGVRVRVPPQVR